MCVTMLSVAQTMEMVKKADILAKPLRSKPFLELQAIIVNQCRHFLGEGDGVFTGYIIN